RRAADRHLRLLQQYFGPKPVYDSSAFRKRFRITQRLFTKMLIAVVETDDYFVQKADATGKLGISSLLKITAALRQLAYASAADALDENLEIAETTTLKCLKRFYRAIIARFGSAYLRSPTPSELQEILQENARRGFVGMIGSVDCTHWQWRNCTTALAGQHKGKEKKPTKILEAVADYNLRIWHCNFGSPGSLNDINVLDQSPLFQYFLQGTAPRVEFVISGKQYDTPYLLADGIYPEWPVFVKPIKKPHGLKQKHFVKRQEACRKDVERCFGVLQARWRIIDTPCRLWRADAMAQVMHDCIILHNMIIEDE
uniref:DDE Tnp4 domain-containing protein n=1 Tax=Phytophthora ramorum TaxID=164328 RepID=H3G773_PHYRM